jgi:hypothetical protein
MTAAGKSGLRMSGAAVSAATRRGARTLCGMMLCMLVISCGGSGGADVSGSGTGGTTTLSGSNVVTAVIDAGPSNNSVNTLFVSVTVCVPGSTTNCQTIDHVEVDTASYGLRILSSVLTLSLPVQTVSGGGSLVECTNFVQGYSWGPVALASVQIGGESAASLPVQIIGDPNFTNVPDSCTGLGNGMENAVDTVAEFGANAILGVGPFAQDCGSACAAAAVPGAYYTCSGTSTCVATAVPLSLQVQNPVSAFATDNNGVIVQLPSVPAAGSATLSGYLIFGIDTESNNASNASGTETVLTVDGEDYLTVTFNGQNLSKSFIDSGTNGIYFNDGNLPVCTASGLTDFYCPSATTSFNATLTGNNGVTASAQFSVANTQDLLNNNPSFTVFADLAGTYPGSTTSFDFGLPFYYGRRVATAIEGNTTTVGTGPYFAF